MFIIIKGGIMGVKENIKARKAAEEYSELIADEIGADGMDRFLEELIRRLKPVESEEPEEEKEKRSISELGSIQLRFGEHLGKSLDEIPEDDLTWLQDVNEQTANDLGDYLNHKDFERRRRGITK